MAKKFCQTRFLNSRAESRSKTIRKRSDLQPNWGSWNCSAKALSEAPRIEPEKLRSRSRGPAPPAPPAPLPDKRGQARARDAQYWSCACAGRGSESRRSSGADGQWKVRPIPPPLSASPRSARLPRAGARLSGPWDLPYFHYLLHVLQPSRNDLQSFCLLILSPTLMKSIPFSNYEQPCVMSLFSQVEMRLAWGHFAH